MSILITGATGFLGGALTAELLGSSDWPKVLLLVRAENPAHAHTRVIQRLRRFAVADEHLSCVRPEQIVCVNLATPLPLPDNERLKSVRRVAHCAASTSFGANKEVFSTNVDGTMRLAQHLHRIATLERFVYVSTAMICGTRPGTIVHEDDYPHDAVEHFVSYTRSKANAEKQLRTLLGLPLVVVRPSIIVGHTQLGCHRRGSGASMNAIHIEPVLAPCPQKNRAPCAAETPGRRVACRSITCLPSVEPSSTYRAPMAAAIVSME